MNSGIYKLYWNNCSYYYIGASKNFKSRFSGHSSELKRGVHKNKNLQKIYNEYGCPEYKVLTLCEKHEFYDNEKLYLQQSEGDPYCANLWFDPIGKGHKHTEEARRNNSNAQKGKVMSEEFKRKKAEYMSTKTLSNAYRAKKVINTETLEVHGCAIELALLGIVDINANTFLSILSGKTKTNPTPFEYLETYIANGNKKREPYVMINGSAKKVINVESLDTYISAADVVKRGLVNMNCKKFWRVLSGEYKNNTPFMYLEDYEKLKSSAEENLLSNCQAKNNCYEKVHNTR